MAAGSAMLPCVLLAIQALQLSLVAAFWAAENRRANRVFALALLLIALPAAGAAAVLPRGLTALPYPVLHAWGSVVLLVSPCLYLYIRLSVGGFQPGVRTALHFLPAGVHLCLLVPLALVDGATRAQWEAAYRAAELYRTFIPHVRVGAVQATVYWVGCFFWVRRLERHIRETASFSDRPHLIWLKSLTGLLVLLWAVLAFGRVVDDAHTPLWVVWGFACFMTVVNTAVMARPHLLHGLPTALQLTEAPEPVGAADAREAHDTPNVQRYRSSALAADQKRLIADKLTAYFAEASPYLAEDLTLVQVADALGVARGALSQVINETLGRSFVDFVNDYRIDTAKALLEDPTYDHLGVDGIALEAGFRSRSVFYTAFKKRLGKTPAAWRTHARGDA